MLQSHGLTLLFFLFSLTEAMAAAVVRTAQITKAVSNKPVDSAKNPANAGPTTCPAPKNIVTKPNADAALRGPTRSATVAAITLGIPHSDRPKAAIDRYRQMVGNPVKASRWATLNWA